MRPRRLAALGGGGVFAVVIATCTTTTNVRGPESRVTIVVGPSIILGDSNTVGRFTFFPDGGSACGTPLNTAPSSWNVSLPTSSNPPAKPPTSLFGIGSRVAVAEQNNNSETLRQGLSGPVHMWDGGAYAFVNLTTVDGGGASAMASLLFPRHSAKAITTSRTGGILVVGGLKTDAGEFGINGAGAFEPNIEYLDPTTGRWRVVHDGGEGSRVHHTVTELADGRIIVIGGVVGAGAVGSDLIFDPTTRVVQVLQPLLSPPVFGHTASVAATAQSSTSNEVIVFGGATTLTADAGADALPISGLQTKVSRLNFEGSTPARIETANVSVGVAFHAAAVPRKITDRVAYWIGGASGSPPRAIANIFSYDMVANTLGVSASLAVKRMLHVAVENPAGAVAEMWVVGGVGVDGGLVSSVETVLATNGCCTVTGVDVGTPRAGLVVGEMPFGAPDVNAAGRLLSVPTRYVVVGGRGATGAVVTKAEAVFDGGVSSWGNVSGVGLGAAVASTPWGVVIIGGLSAGAVSGNVLSIGEQVSYETAVTAQCQ